MCGLVQDSYFLCVSGMKVLQSTTKLRIQSLHILGYCNTHQHGWGDFLNVLQYIPIILFSPCSGLVPVHFTGDWPTAIQATLKNMVKWFHVST